MCLWASGITSTGIRPWAIPACRRTSITMSPPALISSKIMCDGYFPYPVPESVKAPADWKSLKPLGKDHPFIRDQVERAKQDRGGQGQGDVRVLQRVRAVLLHPFRYVG